MSRCGNCIRLHSELVDAQWDLKEREHLIELAIEYRKRLKATGRAGAAEYMAFMHELDAEIMRRESATTIDQRTEAAR